MFNLFVISFLIRSINLLQKLLIVFPLRQKSYQPSGLEAKKRIVLVPQKNQTTGDASIKSPFSTKTEIIWVLKSTMSSYSNNSCAILSDSFKRMLPDSKVAPGPDLVQEFWLKNFIG